MLPFNTMSPFYPDVPNVPDVGIECVILEARLLCSIYIALCSVVRMRFVIHFKFIVYVDYVPTPSHIQDEHNIYSVFIKSFLSLGIIRYFQKCSNSLKLENILFKYFTSRFLFPIALTKTIKLASIKIVTIQCEVKIKV